MDKKNKSILERFLEFLGQIAYIFSFYVQEIRDNLFGTKKKKKVEKTKEKPKKRETTKNTVQRQEPRKAITTKPQEKEKPRQVRQVNIEDIWEAIQEEEKEHERAVSSQIRSMEGREEFESHITEISLDEIRKKREEEAKRQAIFQRPQETNPKKKSPQVVQIEEKVTQKSEDKKQQKEEKQKKEKKSENWLKNRWKEFEESGKKRGKSIFEKQKERLKKLQEDRERESQEELTSKEDIKEQETILDVEEKIEGEKTSSDTKIEELKEKQEEQEKIRVKLQEQRKLEEQKRLQEERKEIEQRKLEEQRKLQEQRREEEQKRLKEQQRLEEQKRIERQKLLEQQKRLQEARKAEEQKNLEEQRKLQEQKRIEEQKRLEEQKKLQEQQRYLSEQKRKQEQERQLEELRKKQQEQNRIQAEERRRKEQAQLEAKIKKQRVFEEIKRQEEEELEALKREQKQVEQELRIREQQEKKKIQELEQRKQEQRRIEGIRKLQQEQRGTSVPVIREEVEKEQVSKDEFYLKEEEVEKEQQERVLPDEIEDQETLEEIAEFEEIEEEEEHKPRENFLLQKFQSFQEKQRERKVEREEEILSKEEPEERLEEERQGKKDLSWIRNGSIAAFIVIGCMIILNAAGSFVSKKFPSTTYGNSTTQQEQQKEETTEATPIASVGDTVTLTFVGDIMCHSPQFTDAYNAETGEYDFSKNFELVKSYLEEGDLTIGNLETVFAGKEQKYSGYPTFNTPDDLAKELKNVGFDVLTTANNHCADRGATGITRTLDVLDEVGISHVGTYRSAEEKNQVLIKEVKGMKLAFVSFTTFINGEVNGTGLADYINFLTLEEIQTQMQIAKEQNPDCIIVLPHWGEEYETLPNSTQQEMADILIDAGADIIVGSHPHVIQKMGKKKVTDSDGNTKEVFIAYSMGNFLSNQGSEYTRDEMILNVTIKKGANGISVDKIGYRPVYMNKEGSLLQARNFQLVDIISYKKEFSQGGEEEEQNLYNAVIGSEERIKLLLGGEAEVDENAQEIESSAIEEETTTQSSLQGETQTTTQSSTSQGETQTMTQQVTESSSQSSQVTMATQ